MWWLLALAWSQPEPRLQEQLGHADQLSRAAWSADRRLLATSEGAIIVVWDAEGHVLRRLVGVDDPDDYETLAVADLRWEGPALQVLQTDGDVVVWDPGTGVSERHHVVEGPILGSFSADGARVAWAREAVYEATVTVGISRVEDGVELAAVESYHDYLPFWSITWHPDGDRVALAGSSVAVWNLDPSEEVYGTEVDVPIDEVRWSADGAMLELVGEGGELAVFDPETEQVTVGGSTAPAVLAAGLGRVEGSNTGFSVGAQIFDTGVRHVGYIDVDPVRGTLCLYEVADYARPDLTRRLVLPWPLRGHAGTAMAEGCELNEFDYIGEFPIYQGSEPAELPDGTHLVQVSPSDALVLARDSAGLVLLGPDAEVVQRLADDPGRHLARFTPDERAVLTTTEDGRVAVFDVATGARVATLSWMTDDSWAVLDDQARFDGPNGGQVAGLHWVVGTDVVGLAQLRERYFTPDLVDRHLGVGEPLADVPPLTASALAPQVEATLSERGWLTIHLEERGGGVGRVGVWINGKEVTADAASSPLRRKKRRGLILDLSDHPYRRSDVDNRIEVRAFNADGWLSSRGSPLVAPPTATAGAPPHLFAIVAGVSDYAGGALDLSFASKDAADFAAALELSATALLGRDRVHVTALNDDGTPATRDALLSALAAAAKRAKATDTLVVYLAGHGVTAQGEYNVLLADAASADLADPDVRARVALSSAELTEAIKEIAALRQVLVLDTCASGAAVGDLTRAAPSSKIRALHRLQDRTGTFVLAGSAADAVSYEASRFGQGLLTHSLLFGMKGPGLIDGDQLDVRRLFEYAADRVPELALDIGGIQRPVLAAPRGASFPLGLVDDAVRTGIPTTDPRPVAVRSLLQHDELMDDVDGLSQAVDERLRQLGASGAEAPLVFVDAPTFPGSFRIAGRYTSDAKVQVRAVVGGVSVVAEGADVTAAAAALVNAVLAALPEP
jgi:hypothetical protein